MQVRRTDGTVVEVPDAEGRRLIREGNAQAVTEETTADDDSGGGDTTES